MKLSRLMKSLKVPLKLKVKAPRLKTARQKAVRSRLKQMLDGRKRRASEGKIVRWKYVAPRLAILFVLYVVCYFGLDPALRWAAIMGGESAVGAKVELAELETSFWDGTAKLKGLAIANPQAPMRNLLESPDSEFFLDTNALLHGRVVITDGTLGGLQFDTDRETSGALEVSEAEEGPSALDPLLASAGDLGDEWIDDISDRLDTDIVDKLESPRLAKELQERWPAQYTQLEQEIKDIRARGKSLQQDIRELKKNPLRGISKLPEMQQQLVALQTQVKSVQQQLGALPRQAEADRQAVLAARVQDEALIREQLQFKSLDGEGLTQMLLGKSVNEGLVSTLGWVSWARDLIPTGAKKQEERSRGTTVIFTPMQPDFLIQKLNIVGAAQLDGKPLTLLGTLTNASSAPKLLEEPTRLTLAGSEALDLDLEIVLDRRGEIANDHLHFTCPQLAMTGRTLGNADKLVIEMNAGNASFVIDIRLTGEQLAGTIVFTQDSLQLTPQLAKSPNGKLAKVLTESLAGIQRLGADVTLSGTLKKPKVKIKSDIGSQVAAGMNESVRKLVTQETEKVLAKSREKVDAELAKIDKLRTEAQDKLLAQLGEGQELLGQIAALTGGGKDKPSLGGLPLNIPQLGKKFGFGGFRK